MGRVKFLSLILLCLQCLSHRFEAFNQTKTVDPVLPGNELPFSITVEKESLTLPCGVHSGAFATHEGKWLFLTGRTNGLHDFSGDTFPKAKQNTNVIVVDLKNQKTYLKPLHEASGLTQKQIETLSVSNPQFFQKDKMLYITGGFGFNSTTKAWDTKPILTAIEIPRFINWVIHGHPKQKPASLIRQIEHPLFQVTGGNMFCVDEDLNTLLIFGQKYKGKYISSYDGTYTNQVRCFQIIDEGNKLAIVPKKSASPKPEYRRRDLNVLPMIKKGKLFFAALSGVFTPTVGVWTVPVEIETDGTTFMEDPASEKSFKQAMNNYGSACVSLYSPSTQDSYAILFGGLTYECCLEHHFIPKAQIPFTNQITTVKRDSKGFYSQYLMDEQFPKILSSSVHPGNTLLFGTAALFIPSDEVPMDAHGIVDLDAVTEKVTLGYIIGGIMSTVPNTASGAETAASPYIFKVTLAK